MSQKDEEEQTRRALVKEFMDHQIKWADYQARIASLSPEERAIFDRLWEEERGDDEFVNELMQQVKSGVISPEEADRRLSSRRAKS